MKGLKVGIIGLGISGLSIAARLAECGHAVHGFEQFDLLHGHGGSHGAARLFRRFPGEGETYAALGEQAYHGWRRWNEEAGEALFVECGGIDAAPAGDTHILNVRKFTEAYYTPLEVLTGAEVKARHPQYDLPDDWIAVYQPTNGYTRPDATKAFLARKAEAAGAILTFGVRVGLSVAAQTIELDGRHAAFDRIIVTAGAWMAKLVPQLSMLTPERRVLMRLQSLTGDSMPQAPIYSAAGHIYASPTVDGEISLGKSGHFREACDPDRQVPPNARDIEALRAASGTWLHGMTETGRFETGMVMVAPDTHFVIGDHPDSKNVLLFNCCSGHGFKYAPTYGDIALDWIAGRARPDLSLFRAERLTHG